MKLNIILGILVIVTNLFFATILIFFERKNPSTTWAWLLVIIFLPFIGFIIYMLLGRNLSKEKLFTKKIIVDERKKCDYLLNSRKEYVLDEGTFENIDLIKMNYRNSNSFYTQKNNIDLIFDGKEKFKELFSAIENSKSFIHIEYYIISRDETGKMLIDLLTKKAKENVEVKILFDSMGSYKINSKSYLKNFVDSGGKYAVFFPALFPHLNKRINFRNHRKIAVIDGKVGFVGGFNIGNEYLSKDKKIGYWRDTHLKIAGEAVRDLEERFLMDWTYASEEIIHDYGKYLTIDMSIDEITGTQIVSSGPDHKSPYIRNGFVKIINNAKKNVYVQSPYFIPDETTLESLKLSALSGVDVRIMIPGVPDHKFMFWAASSYVGELLKSGVRVYYYNKGFLHSKTIVSDSNVCSIGSANMDIRSFKLNFETNCFIYNENISNKMEIQFKRDILDSKEVTLDFFENRGLWVRFAESITRLLSPIL
ncbi:cardiolipin synthase [Clostridium algidicarnis]|uniref:Cardiolipin synthase n=2 Tax=Clostridium algidicarnis TaxID=37659 RepID=A0A2S6G1K6_9CLOT|nr:cardiolipin synthase [Clostridium algidicarnis]MBB6631149.1 cardiolipin synthase [Clostridium algidicarnis]MBU3193407.1 cardiolipin synthase [Clostridium algidicarnis]MBU3205525.1 cardiolipin synthase [Clostridium algidicarnis]MBU3218717.1 cardiolipin synthase [Clostridium algidicarnis]MCB2285570.1 cardiolipin synthase [Clostridium algidicarnis]